MKWDWNKNKKQSATKSKLDNPIINIQKISMNRNICVYFFAYGLPYGENDNEAWVESDDMDVLEDVMSDVDMEIGDDDGILDIE